MIKIIILKRIRTLLNLEWILWFIIYFMDIRKIKILLLSLI